jgi:LysM repeat protein
LSRLPPPLRLSQRRLALLLKLHTFIFQSHHNMFAQVYTVALLAIFAQSAFAATCSRTYTIVAGDYCDKISQAQKVSTYQLSAINPSIINKGCSNLTPGESICLGFVGEDCSTTQVVQPGDTCTGIADANALNTTILYLNNPQLDKSCNIYVGEVLCTSKTVQVPAIPASGITVSMSGSTPVSTIIPLPSSAPSNPAAIAAAPSSTSTASDPTDDCDDESTDPTPNPTASTAPAEHSTVSAPEPTNGGDDEDLPFCDEL